MPPLIVEPLIVEFPMYIKNMSCVFAELFKQERTINWFRRFMTGFVMCVKHIIAHMNGLSIFRTSQCNLNRFVTNYKWKIEDINKKKIELIAANEKDVFVVIDDYVVEKYRKICLVLVDGTLTFYEQKFNKNLSKKCLKKINFAKTLLLYTVYLEKVTIQSP